MTWKIFCSDFILFDSSTTWNAVLGRLYPVFLPVKFVLGKRFLIDKRREREYFLEDPENGMQFCSVELYRVRGVPCTQGHDCKESAAQSLGQGQRER